MVAEFIPLKAPFPWFGGKSRVASLVWQAFGDCPNYVEPFYGSGATLLHRPNYDPLRHTETVNDLDCYLANFWRSLQHDPEAVAYWCDYPVNEADLIARHQWLIDQAEFRDRFRLDPTYFDTKIAGWWVWGLCAWIGSGWCKTPAQQLPHLGNGGQGIHRKLPHLGNGGQGIHRKLPHLGSGGQGIHRKLPHLGDGGQGIHRKLPHLGNGGRGIHRKLPHLGDGGRGDLHEYLSALADRLRRVRVCCGDWARVLTPSITEKHGLTAVFLDPPYEDFEGLYSAQSSVSAQVREWALANGSNPKLRIALCGYAGEHDMPDEWRSLAWKGAQGYAKNDNCHRERIWFSPACLPVYGEPEVRELIDRMKSLGRTITHEQALSALKAA